MGVPPRFYFLMKLYHGKAENASQKGAKNPENRVHAAQTMINAQRIDSKARMAYNKQEC